MTKAPEPTPSHTDADYQAAVHSVRRAIHKYEDCTDSEREVLASDLDGLRQMAEKLETGRVDIVVFGEISTGKSALINALVGHAVTDVNVQGGWTQDVWNVPWDDLGYKIPGLPDSQVMLVDTPGLNEVDGEQHSQIAREAAARADLVLFVTDSDLNDTEYSAILELAASHKPLILVLNKADLYSRKDLAELLEMFRTRRLASVLDAANIVVTQAAPREMEYIIESADGSTRSRMAQAAAQDR